MAQRQAEREEHVLLERESEYWEANREALTEQYPNMWLLIGAEGIVGHYSTYREAERAMYTFQEVLLPKLAATETVCEIPSVQVSAL